MKYISLLLLTWFVSGCSLGLDKASVEGFHITIDPINGLTAPQQTVNQKITTETEVNKQ